MSALVTVEIEFDKRTAVTAALEEMGYKVQVSETGNLTIRGESGVFTTKAEVLAQKGTAGQRKMYSDLGFERNESGKLKMIVSDVDQYWMGHPQAAGYYGDKTAGEARLKQLYGKHVVLEQAKIGRWNTKVEEKNDEIRVQLRRYV